MPGTPDQHRDDVEKEDAKSFAARSIFTAAGLTVIDEEARCWKVRNGNQPSAPWFLFWPVNGFWRAADTADTADGTPRGYGASALVAAIRTAPTI